MLCRNQHKYKCATFYFIPNMINDYIRQTDSFSVERDSKCASHATHILWMLLNDTINAYMYMYSLSRVDLDVVSREFIILF